MSTPRKPGGWRSEAGPEWVGTLYAVVLDAVVLVVFVIAVWPGVSELLRHQVNGMVIVVGSTVLALLAAVRPSSTFYGRFVQRWVVPLCLLAATIELTAEQAGGDVVMLVALFFVLLLFVAMWVEWRRIRPRE